MTGARCLQQLRLERTLTERDWGITGKIGNARGCFERQQACGVCDQNNLIFKYSRRGRSPSGCNHFPETCPANGSMSLTGRPFLIKFIMPLTGDRAPGSSGMDPGRHLQPNIAVSSIALNLLHRKVPSADTPTEPQVLVQFCSAFLSKNAYNEVTVPIGFSPAPSSEEQAGGSMENEKRKAICSLVGVGLTGELLCKIRRVFSDCYLTDASSNLTPLVELCRNLGDALLLVPLDLLPQLHGASFSALSVRHRIRVLTLTPLNSPGVYELAIAANCAGVLSTEASDEIFERAFEAIQLGELWYPRAVLSHLAWSQITQAAAPKLTRRETEILQLVGTHHKNQVIADRLFISRETVRWHLRLLYSKIGVAGRLEAQRYAQQATLR